MIKQTIQASDFTKKSYSKPFLKVRMVKPVTILAASGGNDPAPSSAPNKTELYEVVSTDGWF